MKQLFTLYLFLLLLLCSCYKVDNQQTIPAQNTYFSKTIVDPFQYLENVKDPEVLAWLHTQNELTNTTLHNISGRSQLIEKMQQHDAMRSSTIFDLKVLAPNAYYYLKYHENQETDALYFKAGIEGEEIEIFNAANYKVNTPHTYIINYFQPSWNGQKIAIGFTKNDEEFSEVVIYDVQRNTFHEEIIDHCWPSELGGIHWLDDNSGFTYLHIPDIDTTSPNYILNSATVLYRLGTDPKDLHILFSRKTHPELNLSPADFPIVNIFGRDQQYMFGRVGGIGFKDYYYAAIDELHNDTVAWKPLFKKAHKVEKFLPHGDDIFFTSAQQASTFGIYKTSLTNVNFDMPTEVIPPLADEIVQDFTFTSDGLFYTTTKNRVAASLYHLQDKKIEKLNVPKAAGSIQLSTISDAFPELWIETEGWTSHKNRYRYDTQQNTFYKENIAPVLQYPELQDVIVEEIEITSHDGVKVPLSLIYKKGIQKDGNNRVLLNGYGCYNWINAPMLYPYLLYWIAEGGMYAVAHVRGGGEKGEQWHKDGFKSKKPNTWKDFIACTEYLIETGFTSPKRMAVWGGSAGGINIGRAVTERPDLYAAVVIRVGLLNTLRSEIAPNGQNNIKE